MPRRDAKVLIWPCCGDQMSEGEAEHLKCLAESRKKMPPPMNSRGVGTHKGCQNQVLCGIVDGELVVQSVKLLQAKKR